MDVLGGIIMFAGVMTALIGVIWLLVEAFKESFLWGFGCLLVPYVGLIFVITHWEESKEPFFISILGSVAIFFGPLMIGLIHY